MPKLAPSLLTLALLAGVTSGLQQYTPDQADYSTFQTKALAGNDAHDPDGVTWISAEDWEASEWDGTVYNPSRMTKADFVAAICPSVDRIRGIREVFYKEKPFADNVNPTKAEIDNWHRIALNHVRALIGYTSEERQAKNDICMSARALWGDERKHTTMWDDKYPGTLGSAAGPCVGQTNGNSHCGASFLPDAGDQAPYLPDGHAACQKTAGSEGVFSGPKSNIPWSLKWSRGLCNTLHAEGFWGGHTGPFFHREKFGFSFWDADPNNNNNNAGLRAKWTGRLSPSLYCKPGTGGCVVADTPVYAKYSGDGVSGAAGDAPGGAADNSGLSGGAVAAIVVVMLLLTAGAGGGAFYWFKVKPAKDSAKTNTQVIGQQTPTAEQVDNTVA